jgi:hypothetical protein
MSLVACTGVLSRPLAILLPGSGLAHTRLDRPAQGVHLLLPPTHFLYTHDDADAPSSSHHPARPWELLEHTPVKASAGADDANPSERAPSGAKAISNWTGRAAGRPFLSSRVPMLVGIHRPVVLKETRVRTVHLHPDQFGDVADLRFSAASGRALVTTPTKRRNRRGQQENKHRLTFHRSHVPWWPQYGGRGSKSAALPTPPPRSNVRPLTLRRVTVVG